MPIGDILGTVAGTAIVAYTFCLYVVVLWNESRQLTLNDWDTPENWERWLNSSDPRDYSAWLAADFRVRCATAP